MKVICIGKGIVIVIDSIFGLFGHKTKAVVQIIKQQKSKMV